MSRSILLLLLLLGLVLPISDSALAIEIPFVGNLFGGSEEASSASQPATPTDTKEWWRKHRKKAVFVPGQGYRVHGYDGFYDEQGRSIDAPIDEITVKLTAELEEGGLIPGVDPKLATQRVREAMGLGPSQQAAQDLLTKGIGQFGEQKYTQAADTFEKAAARWPGSAIESKALFNVGESYFFAKKYKDASDAFIVLLDKHPSTPRLNDTIERLWSIAQYWEEVYFASDSHAPLDYNAFERTRPTTDTIGHAVKLYEAIRLNDPTGPRADDAIMATAGIHFRRLKFHDADYHYGLLRNEYPRSEHLFNAHLLGLQAKLKKYQGADYDGTPLKEAKRLEERIRTNFAGQLSEGETTRLIEVRAQLAASIEERDLRMADYYLGTDQNLSAKVYLNKIVEDYAGSPAAEKARQQLATIGSAPDSPEVPLSWLVDLFPANQEQSAINGIVERVPEGLMPGAGQTQIAEQPKDPATATTTR